MSRADFTGAVARAKGLATHLFTRGELEALAGSDLPSLARTLAHAPKLSAPLDEHASAVELEHAVRQTSRRHLLTLSRWEGAAPVLGVFFAEQDRRSLRAMLRGALAAAPSEERLAGLIPTPTLPERVLVELARQPTPAAVMTVLFAVGHPFAEPLLPLTAMKQPDLLALELALTRAWARWTSHEAARGDENLQRFVAERLDAVNVELALLRAAGPDVEPEDCFVEGGTVSREAFLANPEAPPRAESKQPAPAAKAVRGTPLAPLLSDVPVDAARFERDALRLALDRQRAVARVEPLSSAPMLTFLLRLEAQARDLRRVIWAAVLGAPAVLVTPELVTS